jgi:hypothetical protein
MDDTYLEHERKRIKAEVDKANTPKSKKVK